MARASSSLSYPDKFFAAAAYAGLDGSTSPTHGLSSKFSSDVALILLPLGHVIQQSHELGIQLHKVNGQVGINLEKWPSTEAMRHFVKILEEEVPGWYSRTDADAEADVDVQVNVKIGFKD